MDLVATASRVLARLHRWSMVASLLARVPVRRMDGTTLGRLRYALSLVHLADPARASRTVEAILRRNPRLTPAGKMDLASLAIAVGDRTASCSLLGAALNDAAGTDVGRSAAILLRVEDGLADGSLLCAMEDVVRSLRLPPGRVILTPVSAAFLDLWALWAAQVKKHVDGTPVVMAMDDAAWTALRNSPGIAVADLRQWFTWQEDGGLHPQLRGLLWLLRALLLRQLCIDGHEVLVLDVDAVPVADLQPLVNRAPEAGVTAQQDCSIPMEVCRRYGFVLCCGCMAWRPGPQTLALLERLARQTALERDDQLALNHLLAAAGLLDLKTEQGGLRFTSAGVRFACPGVGEISRSAENGRYIRHFHRQDRSVSRLRAELGL